MVQFGAFQRVKFKGKNGLEISMLTQVKICYLEYYKYYNGIYSDKIPKIYEIKIIRKLNHTSVGDYVKIYIRLYIKHTVI